MARTFLILGSLCGAALPGVAPLAIARPAPEFAAAADFDLAQTLRNHGRERRFRLGQSDRTPRFRDEKVKPEWTYSPIDGGPSVELGALGGGRKGSPKLAHVRVDWNF
ncbi:hypothetical protein [Novosphingobium sp. 9U]|uniref:hypothetical protein n=1 Tax=Novosphingobium sp. 9U TaxID=2653158 RepID=UPI00135AC6F7|nr:hypothetical protein [Novosphingobium sp. 9U]